MQVQHCVGNVSGLKSKKKIYIETLISLDNYQEFCFSLHTLSFKVSLEKLLRLVQQK